MSKKEEIACSAFYSGYNCAQSVAIAFAPEMRLSKQRVAQLAAGFGGGLGRMREACGAFCGAVLVLGALYGSEDPSKKTDIYRAVQDLAAQFVSKNGKDTLLCRELLGLKKGENASPFATIRTPEFYQKRPCLELIRLSAVLLEQYIRQHPLATADNANFDF